MFSLFKIHSLKSQLLYLATALSTCWYKTALSTSLPVVWNLQQLSASACLCSASFFTPLPVAAYKVDTCPMIKTVTQK